MPHDARLTKMQRFADRYLTDRNWKIAVSPAEFATQRGHTLVELAFSWLHARLPVASVITGAISGGARVTPSCR